MVPWQAGCNVPGVHDNTDFGDAAMYQLIFFWARPLFALGRFYLHRAEVKRRFMRLQQRRLTSPPGMTPVRIVAGEAFRDPSPLKYRDAA